MNPYEMVDTPKGKLFREPSIKFQADKIIEHLTKMDQLYREIDSLFFEVGEGRHNRDNDYTYLVEDIYRQYAQAIMGYYNLLDRCNIKQGNLEDYIQSILRKEKIDGSPFYSKDGLEGIIVLISYFNNKENITKPIGYQVNVHGLPGFEISNEILHRFERQAFELISYMLPAQDLLKESNLELKNKGQAILVEGLFVLIKIGGTLNIYPTIAFERYL